jgi:hypothetical protein
MAILDGVRVKLGGAEYIVPPLSLRSLKKLGKKIQELSNINSVPTEEQTDALLEVIHAALVRNYPDITLDDLADLVDLGNMLEVFPAVLAVSGLKQNVVPGGSPGEAPSPRN